MNHIIKYIDYPICTKCIWYSYGIKNLNSSGYCTKFGFKNLINGKIIYYKALRMRTRSCGLNGTYFEPHNYDDAANPK